MSKNAKYIHEFTGKRCFPDYLKAVGMKMDCKEITECWTLMRWFLHDFRPTAAVTDFMDVGCGRRPTLGVMAALFTHGLRVRSVDPQLDSSLAAGIAGLKLDAVRLEDLEVDEFPPWTYTVLVGNHAHFSAAVLRAFVYKTKMTGVYVTVPCCQDNTIQDVYGVVRRDACLESWSPKSTMYVYEVRDGKFVNWGSQNVKTI